MPRDFLRDHQKSIPSKKTKVAARAKQLIRAGKKTIEGIDIQPIWGRVKKGLEEAAEAMGKGSEKAAEKAMRMATMAGVKYKLYGHHARLQKLLAELGGEVYDLAKRNPQALSPTDPETIELIGRIADMEKRIAALEEKAKGLRK